MKFNSNKERRAYWELLLTSYPKSEIENALDSLKPDIRQVLCLRYVENLSFSEIAASLNRSTTVVRNHHNRGIYKIYRYFNPRSSETV